MITKLGTLNAPIWLGVIHRSIIHPLEFNLKINGILRYIHPVPSVHTAIRARQESGCSWRLLMTSLLFETSQYWHACSRSILLYYNTTTICVGYMSPNIPAKVFRKFFIVSSSSVEVVLSDPPPIENWGGWFCDAGLKVNNEADNFGHFAIFHIPSFLLCGIFINIVYVYRKKDSK